MNEELQPETVQLNIATEQRNAGRDYNEIHIPDSIRVYLATTPSDRLDKESVDNDDLFNYRFGFDAPYVVREQVIAIKQHYGLTCREIRELRRSWRLTVDRAGAKLSPAPSIAIMGWFQVVVLSTVCLAMFMQITFSSEPPLKQGVGLLTVFAIWFGYVFAINKFFIAPWRLLRNVGAVKKRQ